MVDEIMQIDAVIYVESTTWQHNYISLGNLLVSHSMCGDKGINNDW